MTNWDAVVKQARDCHTKQSWAALFESHGDALATGANPKALADVFRLLHADPQSLQYDPAVWGRLIQGCIAAWNLELGREIAEHTRRLASPAVNIPAAQLYLDSGQPATTREIAHRTLRLTGLAPAEKLQLEMLIATSYAEEGKRQQAIRLLGQMRSLLQNPDLGSRDRADFLTRMGRTHFHIGRYLPAAELFYEASRIYRELADWEAATKALFNTAACHLNGGSRRRDDAFAMIEECRRLAEAHSLAGPLSHCEAAYGMEAFQHGDFAAAREHLRRALDYLPISDKSFRRLHILSMLAYTYLAMGRYHLARKFGRQTLDLAALDESDRFKTRYTTLSAELLWEDGLLDESQAQLDRSVQAFQAKGVHTLEELATLNRWLLQSALLNAAPSTAKTEVDEALKKNHHAWLDRVQAEGQLLLTQRRYPEAEKLYADGLAKARQTDDRFHEATFLLGIIQSRLARRQTGATDAPFREFEVLVARLGETPLKCQVLMIDAARAYQNGNFAECERILRLAAKSSRHGFVDRFVLGAWIATLEGRSSRFTADWQTRLVARATRLYFAPTLEAVDERHFRVSGHYLVSLERHPSLAELLHYLLLKSNFEADAAEIQERVWQQSLKAQGWQQKIRNTIMRLRDFFPYTMAPLIVHADHVSLFQEAIEIQAPRQTGLAAEEEIVRLLADTPMSSQQLARRLNVSAATTKRLLKRLTDEHAVEPLKQGRNVYYRVLAGDMAPPA